MSEFEEVIDEIMADMKTWLREFDITLVRNPRETILAAHTAAIRAAENKARREEIELALSNFIPGTKKYYADPVNSLKQRLAALTETKEGEKHE
jgi:hypothetical protein